jgi:serine kinase of HPr protein (carbohydrate metabolism regulator)
MEIVLILVGVMCGVFIYYAFRHVQIHEKKDIKFFKKLTKSKKPKK